MQLLVGLERLKEYITGEHLSFAEAMEVVEGIFFIYDTYYQCQQVMMHSLKIC